MRAAAFLIGWTLAMTPPAQAGSISPKSFTLRSTLDIYGGTYPRADDMERLKRTGEIVQSLFSASFSEGDLKTAWMNAKPVDASRTIWRVTVVKSGVGFKPGLSRRQIGDKLNQIRKIWGRRGQMHVLLGAKYVRIETAFAAQNAAAADIKLMPKLSAKRSLNILAAAADAASAFAVLK